MTVPGIDVPCTRDHPCPKTLDPGDISWAEGCWAYRNMMPTCHWTKQVWVVVSDCGLNGPVVHGVFASPPDLVAVNRMEASVRGWTGFQNTSVLEVELDREIDPDV